MANLDGQSRHRNGQSICCGAARSIISSLNGLYENDAVSILNSTHAALVAAYALAIHIIRSPSSGLARADFEVKMIPTESANGDANEMQDTFEGDRNYSNAQRMDWPRK